MSHAEFSTASKKKDSLYYIHVVIMLALMFGFQFLPEFSTLTHQGMQALGIFLGLLWAWTFVDFIWPSLLGMVAVGLTGFMTIDAAFTAGFGNTTTILVFFVFTLAAYLTATGVCKTVAYWFVSRKSCIGKPYLFMFYLMLACYILGGTAGTMGAIVIGWAVIYEVAHLLNYKSGDAFPAICLVGVVLCSMLGATVLPIRVFAVMSLNNAKTLLNMECSFMGWVIPSFCASFLVMVLFVLATKFIFKPDVARLYTKDDVYAHFREQINLDFNQKVGIAVLAGVVLFASLPGFLPAGNIIKIWLSKFSIGPIAAMAMAIVYAIHKNGEPMMNYAKAIKDGVDWQTIIMLAGSFPVAAMIQSPESGITTLINHVLTALLGNSSVFMITCIFIAFTFIVTQVAHNLVMMIVLAPIICNLSIVLGFNPMPCLMFLAFAANAGIATPGSSVMGAMLFANREWIPVGKCFTYTWVAVAIMIICCCAIGIPIAIALGVGTPIG